MLHKKLKGPSGPKFGLEPIAKTKDSVNEVVKPVGKKLKKRKSERNRNAEHTSNLVDETIETGTKPSPAKKVRKSESSEGCDPQTQSPRKPKPSSESNKSTKSTTVTVTKGTEGNESKKKKQKRKKNKKKNNVVLPPKDEDAWSEKCTLYLKEWKENRSEWKFKKSHQIWLVKNMMDDSRVPDDIFPVFLEYISAAKGQTVKSIQENASKVIDDAEDNEAEMDDPKLIRARNIIQAITID